MSDDVWTAFARGCLARMPSQLCSELCTRHNTSYRNHLPSPYFEDSPDQLCNSRGTVRNTRCIFSPKFVHFVSVLYCYSTILALRSAWVCMHIRMLEFVCTLLRLYGWLFCDGPCRDFMIWPYGLLFLVTWQSRVQENRAKGRWNRPVYGHRIIRRGPEKSDVFVPKNYR